MLPGARGDNQSGKNVVTVVLLRMSAVTARASTARACCWHGGVMSDTQSRGTHSEYSRMFAPCTVANTQASARFPPAPSRRTPSLAKSTGNAVHGKPECLGLRMQSLLGCGDSVRAMAADGPPAVRQVVTGSWNSPCHRQNQQGHLGVVHHQAAGRHASAGIAGMDQSLPWPAPGSASGSLRSSLVRLPGCSPAAGAWLGARCFSTGLRAGGSARSGDLGLFTAVFRQGWGGLHHGAAVQVAVAE